MIRCIVCGQPTNGSVGRAGIKWKSVCQPCKDQEDEALAQRLRAQAQQSEKLLAGFTGAANLNNKE